MMGSMMGGSAGWAMLIFPLILVIVAAVAATAVIRAARTGSGWRPPGRNRPGLPHEDTVPMADRARPDPLIVLRERYARGEISHDEFTRTVEGLLRTEDAAGGPAAHTLTPGPRGRD